MERNYEIVLWSLVKAEAITRYCRTFTTSTDAQPRAEELNRELDKEHYPNVFWMVRLNSMKAAAAPATVGEGEVR